MLASALRQCLLPAGTLLFAMVGGALPALAAQPDDATPARFGDRELSVSLTSGYGIGLQLRDSAADEDVTDVRYVPLSLEWSIGLFEPLGGDSWLRGSLDGTVEVSLVFNTEPGFGVGGAVVPGFRYHFLALGRLVPYIEAGAGFGGIDWNLESQADGYIFFLHAGVGARVLLGESWALVGGWRYQHLSNAYTHRPNRGIDASVWNVGFTRFLD